MSTILNPKYLSMPEQVQKNKNDIEIINQYLQNVYKTSSTLTEDTKSINIEDTDIDINNLNFALLIDRQGHIYKIVDVVGEVVYLNFLTNIPGGTEYNFTGEWVADNNEYYENDLVLYNGNLYLCEANVINSSTPPNIDTTHWSLFVGYGNDISEFVKSEWEKQVNLINESNIVYKTGTIVPYNSAIHLENFTFKKGKTYTIKVFETNSNFYAFYLAEKFDNNVEGGTYFGDNSNWKTIKMINDVVYTSSSSLLKVSNGSVTNVAKLMIVDGSEVPTTYLENNEIIHEKDIEPVLLWENGSPGSNFAEQTITLSENIRDYKYCILKYTTEPNRGAKFIKLGVIYSDYQITDSYPDETPKVYFKSRRFVINGSQIQVGKGMEFNGTSTSFKENAIIPLAIYGSNY